MAAFKLTDYLFPYNIYKTRQFLKKSEKYSSEELSDFQNEKIKKLISYVYEKVPYYREILKERDLLPRDIETVESLQLLPPLTKDILRSRFNDLISDDYKKFNPYLNETSGSTGTPLQFYQDKYVNISRFAFFWRAWNWAGYSFGKKIAILEGTIYEGDKIWDYDWQMNALRISSFKMTQENSEEILKKILSFRPSVLRGYPSSLYQFAKYIKGFTSHNDFKFLKSIITVSETLHENYREEIENVFGSTIYDCYHSWESVCMISQCHKGSYHQHSEYGLLELLDNKNNRVLPGEQGEITATGFYNMSMPLIRYKMRDLAILSDKSCSCEMNHDVVKKIDGRIEDFIVTPEGSYAGRLDAAFKYNKGFDLAQIIQNEKNLIVVYLVKNSLYNENELKILEKHLRDRVGNIIKINFQFKESIERGKNGKLRLVINNYIKN
jgi:phenylacetate-CoA ligase